MTRRLVHVERVPFVEVSNDDPAGTWAPLPTDGVGDPSAHFKGPADRETLDLDTSLPVVGLGAICGIRPQSDHAADGSQRFSVSEFALLADGTRVMLHCDRGLTLGLPTGDIHARLTLTSLRQDVMNVVLPDDDECRDAHPWSWLAELARARGLAVEASDLENLPYEVVFAESVTRWLRGS